MLQLETYTPYTGGVVNTSQRGTNGPIAITGNAPVNNNPAAALLASGFGVPYLADYNDPTQGTVGYTTSQKFVTPGTTSRRSYAALDMLGPNVLDANGNGLNGRKLKVIGRAHAAEIIFAPNDKTNTAIGVKYFNGRTKQYTSVYGRNITLCAGAINSAKILELSGIGDPAILTPLNIPVRVNNPNVGAKFNNQYGTIAQITGPSPFPASGFQIFTDLHNINPVTNAPYYPADGVRRDQLQVVSTGGNNAKVVDFHVHTNALGTSHIVNADPFREAAITLPYYGDGSVSTVGSDAYHTVSFLKALNNMPGITVTAPTPAIYAAGDAALLTYSQIFTNFESADHGNRACVMGTSIAAGAVTDGTGSVFETNRLKVLDCSIIPLDSDGNLNYCIYVVGKVGTTILRPL